MAEDFSNSGAQSDETLNTESAQPTLRQPVPYDEFAKTRRELAELKAKTQGYERAQASQAEKLAKEQGRWQDIATQEQNKAAELAAKLAEYERNEAKREIASKRNLPPELASRIIGNTSEEMEADADALAKWYKTTTPARPAAPKLDGSSGNGSTPPNQTGTATYTREQLKNTEFYRANRKDIFAAQKEGRIRD